MDRTTFVTLVTRHREPLRRFLCALCCGDTALADDIAQDACIKAYLSMDSLKEVDKFASWLNRIAYNTFLDKRRARRENVDEEAAINISADNASDDAFKYQDLYAALAKLPEHERAAILLFYIQGYAIKEIAEIVNQNENAIKQQLSRGRQHLRTLLSA